MTLLIYSMGIYEILEIFMVLMSNFLIYGYLKGYLNHCSYHVLDVGVHCSFHILFKLKYIHI